MSSTASAEPLSLPAAFDTAKRENARIVGARHRLSAARADVVTAGVLPNPTLDVAALAFTHGVVTGGKQELTVGLAQQLPIFGSVGLRKDAADKYASAEEREAAETMWQALCDVKSAYLRLQLAQAKLRLYESAKADLDRAVAIIQERVSGGANPRYDRARVVVERGNLSARLADAEVERAEARTDLALALGGSLRSRELAVSTGLSAPPESVQSAGELVTAALERRPSARAAALRLESTRDTVRAYQRARIPVPELRIAYGRYFNVPGADPSSGGAFLGGINVPLPVFDRNQGRIARAEAELELAGSERTLAQRQIQLEVERAHAELEIRIRVWRTFKTDVNAEVTELRTGAEALYKEGRSSVLELLDAYRAYLESEERRLELQGKAVSASFDLERAVGPRLR